MKIWGDVFYGWSLRQFKFSGYFLVVYLYFFWSPARNTIFMIIRAVGSTKNDNSYNNQTYNQINTGDRSLWEVVLKLH